MRFFSVILICGICFFANAIKPQWVKNVPAPKNSTYEFKVVVTEAGNMSDARNLVEGVLVSMVEHEQQIKVDRVTKKNSGYTKNSSSGLSYELVVNTEQTISTSLYANIEAKFVTDYSEEFKRNGSQMVRLYSLFMVQRPNRTANFDDVKLTTKYGMRGFVRSMIVPGWGQIYKGSAVKGGFILGGAVAVAAGIIITENTRADYIKKMHEQPKFADVYNSKATDWETARNVCIGAAAALYIYNLVDAVAADGAERAIVKKRNNNFSFAPVITPDGGGFSLVYKF